MYSNSEYYLTKQVMNAELLESMFGGQLCLKDLVLETLLLNIGPNLRLGFYKKELPSVIPPKWMQKKFNTMRFVLEFIGVRSINITHWEPLTICTPIIETGDKWVKISIEKDGVEIISCIADFVALQDVQGFLSHDD